MNILIKDMEMPKNCGECLLKNLSPTGESLICALDLSIVPWEERPFDCQLIEIQDKCGKWSDKQKAYRDEYGDVHFGYQCSVCGAIVNKTNYCGACGAKMEGEPKNITFLEMQT